MKRLFLACLLFAGCETANYAPPVTARVARSENRGAGVAKLERGRTLFVHRCIECHTLPPMWKYSREDWPLIVNDMAHRASLKTEDQQAVIAYILEARHEM
jgi:nitrate/TMAO reductase-like tetraheme cytochrome c subunit